MSASYSYSSSSYTSSSGSGDGKFYSSSSNSTTTQRDGEAPQTSGSESYSTGYVDEDGRPVVQQSETRDLGSDKLVEGRDATGRQRIEEA